MVTVDDRTDDEFDAFLKEVGGTVHVQADGGADDEFDAFMKEVGSTVQVICVDDDSDACMDEEAAVGNLDDEFDAFMNEVGGILRDDEFDAFMNEVGGILRALCFRSSRHQSKQSRNNRETID